MSCLISKPNRLFDRDREWRALTHFVDDPANVATLGVVSGRRRQGKTFLLDALCESVNGIYFAATEATRDDSLRLFGETLARQTGASSPFRIDSWSAAIEQLFNLAKQVPKTVVIDEFPYLMKSDPELPSLLQRELDAPGQARHRSQLRLLLCGSAMSVMGKLLSGTAPLRGRAGLELMIRPLSYKDAAKFWDVTDPKLAVLLGAVVGGTPAYRRQFVRNDSPANLADFDDWVCRTVLEPSTPLFREARYLLAEEPDMRELGIYHSVLAAVAVGNNTAGSVASFVGRKSPEIAHPVAVLEDSGLLARDPDAFAAGKPRYRVTEPLIAFYHAIMRGSWTRLELGLAQEVWQESEQRFLSQLVGPHFEQLCREYAAVTPIFGPPGEVAGGALTDPATRRQIEVDVAVFGQTAPSSPRRILALGEAKWGRVMELRHVERLRRAAELAGAKGYDTAETGLVCFGGSGFSDELRAAARTDQMIKLIDLAELFT